MYHGTILDIGIMADTDAVNIPTDHRIEPNCAIFSHHHIAYNCCVFCKPAAIVIEG
jgi:ABC-type uncharacterized transport system substrate-binding protein